MSNEEELIIEDGFIHSEEASIFVRKYMIKDSDPGKIEIVFLHDGLGSTESMGDFPHQLCQSLGKNGISYDRIGHGKSSMDNEPRSINYLDDCAYIDLPFVLTELQIENPILIGASDGGTISLLYAIKFDVAKIIAIAPHALVEERTINGVNEAFEKLNKIENFQKLEYFHGDKAVKLLVDCASIWLSEEFRSWNILDKVGEVSCPVCLIQGDKDEYISKQQCKMLADAIGPHASLNFIEDSPHLLHVSQTNLLLQLCTAFLQQEI